jgi:hypothetical protein
MIKNTAAALEKTYKANGIAITKRINASLRQFLLMGLLSSRWWRLLR